jgi:hypothetical protein
MSESLQVSKRESCEVCHGFHDRQWPRLNFHAAFPDRFANRVRLGRGINQRKRRPELFQSMDIRIRHDRFPDATGPVDRRTVEVIHPRCVESIQLDRIEEIRMPFEKMTEAAGVWVIRMRGNHESGRLGPPKLRQLLEAVDALRGRIEIEQQNVFVLNRAFDSGNEREAASPRVFAHGTHVEP